MEDLRSDLDFLAYFNMDFDDFKCGRASCVEHNDDVLPIDKLIGELNTFRNVEYFGGYLE